MIRSLFLVCSLFIPTGTYAQQPLTNTDVIYLMKSGFSEEIIIAKIRSGGGKFDTSTSALKNLKDAGVQESVILAMIETESPANTEQVESAPLVKMPLKLNEILLKDGTRVELELAYTVSSENLNEGDAVSFLVVQPVMVNGLTVIDRAAAATARVVKAEGGKSWGRGGQLTWAIQHVSAVDGTKVPLHFTSQTKGGGKPGTVTTGIVVTGLLFWPAAPLWGFKKGKPAVIPAGKRFEVFVHGDTTIMTNQVETSLPIPEPRKQPLPAAKPKNRCYENGRKVPCP